MIAERLELIASHLVSLRPGAVPLDGIQTNIKMNVLHGMAMHSLSDQQCQYWKKKGKFV